MSDETKPVNPREAAIQAAEKAIEERAAFLLENKRYIAVQLADLCSAWAHEGKDDTDPHPLAKHICERVWIVHLSNSEHTVISKAVEGWCSFGRQKQKNGIYR